MDICKINMSCPDCSFLNMTGDLELAGITLGTDGHLKLALTCTMCGCAVTGEDSPDGVEWNTLHGCNEELIKRVKYDRQRAKFLERFRYWRGLAKKDPKRFEAKRTSHRAQRQIMKYAEAQMLMHAQPITILDKFVGTGKVTFRRPVAQ